MKFILIVFFIFITTNCYANKVFYDSKTGLKIVDLSGEKTKEDIKKEFGVSDQVEEVKLDKDETTKIENGKLSKFNYLEEERKVKENKEKQRKSKVKKIKQTLNLTDQEWKDLKEALGI